MVTNMGPSKEFSKKKTTKEKSIIWFNPPWNNAVATNVAAKFLDLVDKHLVKDPLLGKHFNRNTIKVSYSCMPNMAAIIAGHNKKKAGTTSTPKLEGCNCRAGMANCILGGNCLTSNVVYKCTVTTATTSKEYTGLTATTFKERFNNHTYSFKHRSASHHSNLSNYIWSLKDKSENYTTTWSIQKLAKPYSKETKSCQLCLTEKTLISLADTNYSINKRNEIMTKCRHRDKYLLKNW